MKNLKPLSHSAGVRALCGDNDHDNDDGGGGDDEAEAAQTDAIYYGCHHLVRLKNAIQLCSFEFIMKQQKSVACGASLTSLPYFGPLPSLNTPYGLLPCIIFIFIAMNAFPRTSR